MRREGIYFRDRKTELIFFSAVLFLFMLLLLLFAQILLPRLIDKLRNESLKLLTAELSTQLESVGRDISRVAGDKDVFTFLTENENWRWFFTQRLETLLTKHTVNVYLVGKSPDGDYVFLLLATNTQVLPAEPAMKQGLFEEVYKKGREITVRSGRYITFIKPLFKEGKIFALIGADFSPLIFREVEGAVSVMRNLMLGMSGVVFLLFFALLFSVVRSGVIERKLYVDPLTGAYNRNMFYRLSRELPLQEYALAVLDIDNFKLINDTYGHDVGDEVLKVFAKRLRGFLRQEDYVIRYGGEEFILLIRKEENTDVAKVVDRVLTALASSPVVVGSNRIRVTASAGVLEDIGEEKNLEEAVRKADLALLEAKRRGKNRSVVYSEETEVSVVPFYRVKEAIEEERIFFFYQPVFDLETGVPVFFEALARMKDETGNIITPPSFLPSIRGTETYRAFTKYVLEKNIEVLLEYPELKVSVNLEISQIVDEDIVKLILKNSPRVEGRLYIEILEYEECPHSEFLKLKDTVERLKDSGAVILIDDFGTGYSNLVRLAELKVDYVKIAGDIVRNISDKSMWSLCRAVVSFCEDVGIKVIAESIEDRETLVRVREAGVRFGQGFYLSKPRSLEELISSVW